MAFFLRLSAALPTPASRARPSFLRFSLRSWLFPPCAYTRRPKLESNFPHHIPQKLLRGCSAGQEATRDARLSHEGTTEHFYLLFASLLPLSCLPPFPPFPRAVRSKTISEHIARVRLRSLPSNLGAFPAPSRRARPAPAAMSSRLFDPRGRRNNACTVARSHSFPLFSSFAVLTLSLLAFRHARNFLGEKSPSNLSNWPLQ